MSMISVHLTRKPGTARFLVAQRVDGSGVLRNEVSKQERPRLQWQRVDSHRAFCSCDEYETSGLGQIEAIVLDTLSGYTMRRLACGGRSDPHRGAMAVSR